MNERKSDCWYKNVCTIEDCNDSCIRYNEIKFLMDSSGIPPAQQIPVILKVLPPFSDDVVFTRLKAIKESIVDYVEKGNNLYITSNNTGNGKTSAALKLMLKYFDEIWSGNGFRVRGIFIHVPTFLNKLRNFEHPLSEEYKENILKADLVIWDDIASTSLSQWDYAQLLIYIDHRVFNKKSNIYTSNIADKAKLDSIMGSRLTSRIYSNSEILEFKGKDYRSIKEEMEGMRNDSNTSN